MLLRFYTERGRFPRGRAEIPDEAIDYVARQVGVERTEIAFYDWSGRTIEYHRAQIRKALGFRECTVADADELTWWLVDHVTQIERGGERVREHLLAECRRRKLEPPTAGRIDRIVRSALSRGEDILFDQVLSRLPTAVVAKLVALVAPAGEEAGELEDWSAVLASIRSDPGNVSLNTMLTEIAKLEAVRGIGVPAEVFTGIAPKIVTGWRGRAAVESPSHLRGHPLRVQLTLLAALLHCRYREITDTLVELLNSTVHRINARAEVRVTNGCGRRRGRGQRVVQPGAVLAGGAGEPLVPLPRRTSCCSRWPSASVSRRARTGSAMTVHLDSDPALSRVPLNSDTAAKPTAYQPTRPKFVDTTPGRTARRSMIRPWSSVIGVMARSSRGVLVNYGKVADVPR
nr:DUF4158 domain-containing protein [Nocardia terpenica]